MRLLLLDNYDSFTYNLAHLLEELGADVVVRRNDAISADAAAELEPTHLVVSPGPGRPEGSGVTLDLIARLAPTTPTLGVCLGHQAIVAAFGGEIGQPTAPPRQGEHDPPRRPGHLRGAAAGLLGRPVPLAGGRPHSRGARGVGDERGRRGDGGAPPDAAVDGVQFHPESVLTLPLGRDLLRNFLEGKGRP